MCATCDRSLFTLISAAAENAAGRCLYIAGSLTILIPLALGLLAVFQWNTVFTVFHTILFRNNYWLFDPRTDPVILILPDSFFFQCGIKASFVILAGEYLRIAHGKR